MEAKKEAIDLFSKYPAQNDCYMGNKLLAMFVIEILFCYARHLCRVFNNFKNHNY